MNKIYLINNIFNEEVILNFENNTLTFNNTIYNFFLKDSNKIIIKNNDLEEEFFTDDSYLFFSDNDLKIKYNKIFLIHNEWFDQAIIFDNTVIERINHKNQKGKVYFNDNELKIIWDVWGEEIFIKNDNKTYIQKSYNHFELKKVEKIPIIVFIHVCLIENWKFILQEQLELIRKTELYSKIDTIYLGILGSYEFLNDEIFLDDKIKIAYYDNRKSLYEIHSINYIKYLSNNSKDEFYILYLHSKGVRKCGNENVVKSWRNMMEFFLIENYEKCLNYLHYFDTIGNNVINSKCEEDVHVNPDHTFHYSGNFWWSKKSYIDKLIFLDLDLTSNSNKTRFKGENWILSNYPKANIGILFQDDTNLHPYHRFVFDTYKELNIIIKKLG